MPQKVGRIITREVKQSLRGETRIYKVEVQQQPVLREYCGITKKIHIASETSELYIAYEFDRKPRGNGFGKTRGVPSLINLNGVKMKSTLGVVVLLLTVPFLSPAQNYLPITAKQYVEDVKALALQNFASDAQLTQIVYSGYGAVPIKYSIITGKAEVWVYYVYSKQRDSTGLIVAVNDEVTGKRISQSNGPPSRFKQNLSEISEPYLDSPEALQKLKISEANIFIDAHPDVKVMYNNLINPPDSSKNIAPGKYWRFVLISGTDTLTCHLDAETGASRYCSVATALEGIPEESGFRLDQNFPNPVSLQANTSSIIRYALNTRQQIRLSVYDVLGRTLAVLQNGIVNEGEYTVSVPATTFEHPGLYFYRLETPNGSASKKFLVQQ